MTVTRDEVFEALDCAADNGHDLTTQSAEHVARDLSDLTSVGTPEELLPHVEAWQLSKKERLL